MDAKFNSLNTNSVNFSGINFLNKHKKQKSSEIVKTEVKSSDALDAYGRASIKLQNDVKNSIIKRAEYVKFINPENGEFILEHLDEIFQIALDKNIDVKGYNSRAFFESINKETYPRLLELSKSESINGDDLMAVFMHDACEHKIEFGDKTVTVPTEFLISLITGIQSLETIKTGNYDSFNTNVEKLIPSEYYKPNEPQYYKIAEGILTQKPELAKLAEIYQNYCEDCGKYPQDSIKMMESFWNSLDKYGFSKDVKLKTIIPDENALLNPGDTLIAFNFNE